MFFQLFIGVMSCLYSVWDIVSFPMPLLVATDHNSATTSSFARCPAQTPACSLSDMAGLLSAGASSGGYTSNLDLNQLLTA